MDSSAQQAARQIHRCWQSDAVINTLTDETMPASPSDGYAIQSALAELRGEGIAGWKIAATAEAGRTHINVDRPLAGRLYESIVHGDGAKVTFGRNRMAVAEAEIVLFVGSDLPPRGSAWTESEVAGAVDAMAPGLEFPDSRFSDFTVVGTACLIADNACAREFVLGERTTKAFDIRSLDALATRLLINGDAITHGHGRDALGGPLKALTWLANTLNEEGIGLSAGDFVTTGVTGKPSPVKSGDEVVVDLGDFGRVGATLVD